MSETLAILLSMKTLTRESRATKDAVLYTTSGTLQEHCGICVNYQVLACSKVEGEISEEGWCKLFKSRSLEELARLFSNG
jgi:hypothetical protein